MIDLNKSKTEFNHFIGYPDFMKTMHLMVLPVPLAMILVMVSLLLPGVLTAAEIKKTGSQSQCNALKLQVLGSGGPEIDDGLASASFLLWIEGKARVMVDAGGGSSLNFEKAGANFNDLQAILLTHLHVDHSVALAVYVKAGYFTGRNLPLPVLGPAAGGVFPSTEAFINALFSDRGGSVYPYLSDNIRQQPSTDFLVEARSIDPSGEIWRSEISDDMTLSAIDVVHGPVPALAWRIDYRGCSVSFSGDMNGSSGNLEKLAINSNLLVANNAIAQQAGRIASNLHMRPQTIGEIAARAGVKKLALSHFMLRSMNKKNETTHIIKKQYKGEFVLTDDLMVVSF